MTTSLEATGIERRQAAATLEAIANSIEKFAVTPELLRKTLEESQQALYQRISKEMDKRFESARENVDQRFDTVDQRIDAVDQRLGDIITNVNDLRQRQRVDSTKLFNLMLAIALGMAGVVGGLIFGQFFQ